MTHRFDPTILREYDIRGIVGRTLHELLTDLDAMLGASAPDPADSPALEDALARLARAIVRGDAATAATRCDGLLRLSDS